MASSAVSAARDDLIRRVGGVNAQLIFDVSMIVLDATKLQLLADSDYEGEAHKLAEEILDHVTSLVVCLDIEPADCELMTSAIDSEVSTLRLSQSA